MVSAWMADSTIWLLSMIVPLVCGAVVTLGAGGALLWKRIIGGAFCGAAVGVLYTLVSPMLGATATMTFSEMGINCIWRVLIFTILATIGVILTELKLPETGTDEY